MLFALFVPCLITGAVYQTVPPNSSEASPTIWSSYANLNHYHYSFLSKLIPYTVKNTEKFEFA